MIRFGLVVGFIIVAAVIAIRTTPATYEVRRSIQIRTSQERLWEILTSISKQTEWRKDIGQVQVLQSRGSDPLEWVETPYHGPAIYFRALRLERPTYFSMSFKSSALRGEWEGTLMASNGLTELHIVERMAVFNPIFRAIFWRTKSLDKFADSFLLNLKNRAENREQDRH